MSDKVYEIVTEQILSQLENEVIPWRKPWNAAGTMDANLVSKKPYRGINTLLTAISRLSQGFESPYWLTFKQAKTLGGQVRKGEKSTIVVFWKRLEVESRDPNTGLKVDKTIPLLRYYRVFNAEQCEGIADKIPAIPENDNGAIAECESVIAGYKDCPEITHNGGRAFYAPFTDSITMPEMKRFDNSEAYYHTLFHECAHSTGHENRLNRSDWNEVSFGSDSYSREELVAEITAAMVSGTVGIFSPATLENTTAYLQNWKRKLTDDPKLIVKAAGQAQKAADYIFGKEFDKDKTEEKTEES